MENEKMTVLFEFKYNNGIYFNVESRIEKLPINIGHKIVPIGFLPTDLVDRVQSLAEIPDGIILNKDTVFKSFWFQLFEAVYTITEILWFEDFVAITLKNKKISIVDPKKFMAKMQMKGIDF